MGLLSFFGSSNHDKSVEVIDVTDQTVAAEQAAELARRKQALLESLAAIEEAPSVERHFLVFRHREMLNAVPPGVDPEWDAYRDEFESLYSSS